MPSVDHSIVELDDGPPGDEGDVEVLWHRASGRACTPPPGPPGDAYDPSSLATMTHQHHEVHRHLHLDPEEDFPHSQDDLVHLLLAVEEGHHCLVVMVLSLLTHGGKVRSKS